MRRRPPRSTRTDTLVPYTTLFRSFGLMGLAVGAFLWSASPWFVTLKPAEATWLVNHDIYWPLAQNAPLFLLTHYPEVNDSFSWLDANVILTFIFGSALCVGGPVYLGLWAADRYLPVMQRPGVKHPCGARVATRSGLHKLAQGLIPAAGVGVFLGLSATTLTLLQHEGVRSEEHTSELQSLMRISYAVFC